jgi:hypothetical protein
MTWTKQLKEAEMVNAAIEHVGFEQGQMVLACTPDSVVLLDEGTAPDEEVNQLLSAVAAGEEATVPMMLIDACRHKIFASIGAFVRSEGEWLLVLYGGIRCTVQTSVSYVTVDARPGEFEKRLFRDIEQIWFYPNREAALDRADGVDLLAGVVRANRATVTMTEAETAEVSVFSSEDSKDGLEADAPRSDVPVGTTTRFAFDPMTGQPVDGTSRSSPGPARVVADLGSDVSVPPSTPTPVPPAEPAAGVELLDLSGPAEPRVALDVGLHGHSRGGRGLVEVLGVRCPADHHNHPNAVYCAQCGRRMGVNHTIVAKIGPRPPLGLLLVDDGSTFSLVADVIVGRDPSTHPDVLEHGADSLRIGGDVAVLSRSHFGLYLDGWSVAAVDLGSSNGTTVRRESGEVVALTTDARTMLNAGDTLLLGDREIRLQLHHVQA